MGVIRFFTRQNGCFNPHVVELSIGGVPASWPGNGKEAILVTVPQYEGSHLEEVSLPCELQLCPLRFPKLLNAFEIIYYQKLIQVNSRASVSTEEISRPLRVSRMKTKKVKVVSGTKPVLVWEVRKGLECERLGAGGDFPVPQKRTWELSPLLCHSTSEVPHATVFLLQGRHSWKLQAPVVVVTSPPQLAPSYILFFVVKSPSC